MRSDASSGRTMLAVLLVLVSVVSGNVNLTTSEKVMGGSRMGWMKALFEHHGWLEAINNANVTLQSQCSEHLKTYLDALQNGDLWASKMYDASGQYSANVLFGNEFWLGSLHSCQDLQLKEYYEHTPPFPATFYVAKFNLTVDNHHIPQSRLMTVGQCVPAACDKRDMAAMLRVAEEAARATASASGFTASVKINSIRRVPGDYNVYADPKVHILGSAVLIVAILMLAASLYEGYLERRYRILNEKDLELAHENHKQPVGTSVRFTYF